MEVSTCYISTSCNRVPNSLDWGLNNLIIFGASNAVAICNPKESENSGAICCTPVGHTAQINCVRWIKLNNIGHEFEFIATSSDKTATIWHNSRKSQYDYVVTSRLVGHDDIVNAASAIYDPSMSDQEIVQPRLIAATASSDSTIKIWIREKGSDDVFCNQTINLKSDFALDLRLSHHPVTSCTFLVYGGTDTKMHLYICEEDKQFVSVMSLSGHEDWIRGIDIMVEDGGDVLIASCAQDFYIRLWRLSQDCETNQGDGHKIKLKKQTYSIRDSKNEEFSFHITLEAVLAGHENIVYGIHWHPLFLKGNKLNQPMKLLSSSMDKTMILWEFDDSLGVWTEKVRVGEVGGNTLGIYGSKIGPNGMSILAHGFQGALHLWNFMPELGQWEPGVTVGGHFGEVLDLDWDPMGQFIISVSSDQTTRLHAPWTTSSKKMCLWYEMARPQVHGFDMACIAMVGRTTFASGADEKVLRAFQAPKNFVENFNRLVGVNLLDTTLEDVILPEGASVPSLGLSNKAVFEKRSHLDLEARHPKDIYPEVYFVSSTLTQPPTEEHLLQNTLWPEVHKMYGHGNEVFCVAASQNGLLLASACKASKADHANIIIWNTFSWKEIGQLSGHKLTITQLEFSPCNKYLLSVSRDRTWCIFSIKIEDDGTFNGQRVAYTDKVTCLHSRIIWTCAWSQDSKFFATGSRDKKVIIWTDEGNNSIGNCLGNWLACSNPITLEDSVTAVDISPVQIKNDSYDVAIGLDNGSIQLYQMQTDFKQCSWTMIHTFSNLLYHHLTVKRLHFSPLAGVAGCAKDHSFLQLASCGTDHAVYVFNIKIS